MSPPSQTYPNLPSPSMSSRFDSYNAKTTSISYPWPREVTGIERIALSAQGDLQRVLSSFFARPIVIALVYSQTTRKSSPQSPFEPVAQPTPSIISSASLETPIVQTRQVHLQCGGKIVCTATSTVRITSPLVAQLFLQEKYAIGQMFRRLEKVPAFELRSVGLGPIRGDDDDKEKPSTSSSSHQLWRKYTLVIPHFECEILEVFPDRQMFVFGEKWLSNTMNSSPALVPEMYALTKKVDIDATYINQGLKFVLAGAILLMVSFEALRLFTGRLLCH